MKKLFSILFIFMLFSASISLAPQVAKADGPSYIFCQDYSNLPFIKWNGLELKRGQIGMLKVLKPTTLYKLSEGNKKLTVRQLKANETYRIYNFLPGALGLGAGMYIDRDNRVKYDTPSKTKLWAVECQYAPYGPKRDSTDMKTLLFHPDDSAFDESRPILYAINISAHTLYSVNTATKEEKVLTLSGKPERMVVRNNKIYVTIVNKPHDPYWMQEKQTGAIDVIDALNFKKVKTIQIKLDPYDIVVDKNNVIYVSGGSGQSPGMYSINTKTGEQSYEWLMHEKTKLELSSDESFLYGYDMEKFIPRSFYRYPIHNGKVADPLLDRADMPWRQVLSFIQATPDGKYIFDNTGQIYNPNFLYVDDLKSPLSPTPFGAIAFDISSNRFFVTWGNLIYQYNYSTFEITKTLYPFWNVENMWIQNGKLYMLTTDSKHKGHIESLAL